MRILFVAGTRPEAIKLAPVIREIRNRSAAGAGLEARVCVTAQQREMLDQALGVFGILCDSDLDVMEDDQSPTQVAAAVLSRLEPVLAAEKPDWVIVQGDTTTAAAASLAAFYARIPVGHVEAGLRTHDKWRPFPEEIHRRVAAVLADLHFAPTARARRNLIAEGIPQERVLLTGNPVIDALRWASRQPLRSPTALPPQRDGVRQVLVTAHRRESFGAPLERICGALRAIAERHAEAVEIVYAVHRNPRVHGPVHRLLGGVPGIVLVPPLDYLELVHMIRRAHLVVTDSGGLQEEAPGLGKPVLVLRDVTERPEAVDAGTAKLVGTEASRIVAEVERLLTDPAEYGRMARAVNPFGDGHAAARIVDALTAPQ
jgi:UDP-N-acetylglucosamine 2-epimerase (non-hydrolysing)